MAQAPDDTKHPNDSTGAQPAGTPSSTAASAASTMSAVPKASDASDASEASAKVAVATDAPEPPRAVPDLGPLQAQADAAPMPTAPAAAARGAHPGTAHDTAPAAERVAPDVGPAMPGAAGAAARGDTGPAPRDLPHFDTKHSEPSWSVLGRVVAARVRAWADRAGHRAAKRTLRIGVSARIFHPEPDGKGLRGKTLQYLEESISHWVMSRDVLVFMVPTVGKQGMLHASNIRLRDYAKHLDALVLQGGADVSPQSFAEPTTRPEWPGDRVRDMYELELLHEFIESGKPVLGVCRGCQLINVAFGGTLYQDIATDVPAALPHVNDEYDRLTHAIRFAEGASFAGMFGGRMQARVNSIHHQAVDRLGRDLVVEAVSTDDNIVEAIRYQKAPFVVGVQWHPEFHRPNSDTLLDCSPLLDHFLRAARETRF